MEGAPNSYKDPFWARLAGTVESKLDLPRGILTSVITSGERSNHDQVSEAGARTVAQITPTTRKAVIDKYGIDPYLSPENAVESAGLLLKESLARNNGDVSAAVGEYHGGTDRSNWGKRTNAYIDRVLAGMKTSSAGPSTFDKAKAAADAVKVDPQSIANVYAAYQAGQMTPQEAAQFESDVQAGHIMLPRGASLKGQEPQGANQGAMVLPAGVIDAYAKGQMSPEEKAQLEADVASGLVRMPPGMMLGNSSAVAQIPGADPNVQFTPPAPEPSFGDKVVGAGETAANLVTGATGGTVGMAGGLIKGLAGEIMSGQFGTPQAADRIEQSAMQGADALTYMPRTQTGQDYAAAAADAMGQFVPVMPLTGEMAGLARSGAAAQTAAADAARATASKAAQVGAKAGEAVKQAAGDAGAAVKRAAQPVLDMMPGASKESEPTAGTMASGGAAGTDVATQRRVAAQSLDVPIDLTKGQADRTFDQQRFEQEAAKDPEAGAPLRERFADQNQQVLQNFDSWIDKTGAEATSPYQAGVVVDKALREKAARDKAEIRVKYREAEKAGEMEAPVSMDQLVQHLNDQVPEAETAPVLKVARQKAIRLGIAEEAPDGTLVPREVPLKTAEIMRKSLNQATDNEPTNIRQTAIMKGLIDDATDGLGGDLYKQARAARARYAQQYENVAVISDLLNNKRNMADRKVAFEDVFRRTILNGSLDDVRTVRKTLQTGGEQGKQAWRELQGQTLQHIRDEATKGVQTDVRGNPLVSAAGLHRVITSLDKDGKLDFIFGKRGAEQLRTINELAKVIYTSPPGAVNHSNTASVIMAAVTEAAVTGSLTGLPVPVMSGLKALASHIKDRKIRARVAESLGQSLKPATKQAAKKAATTTHK